MGSTIFDESKIEGEMKNLAILVMLILAQVHIESTSRTLVNSCKDCDDRR